VNVFNSGALLEVARWKMFYENLEEINNENYDEFRKNNQF